MLGTCYVGLTNVRNKPTSCTLTFTLSAPSWYTNCLELVTIVSHLRLVTSIRHSFNLASLTGPETFKVGGCATNFGDKGLRGVKA